MTQITDMVTLRAFALKQAVESKEHPDYILVTARKYAAFIKGEAELPEYEDPNAGQKALVEMYKTKQAEREKSEMEFEEVMKRFREKFDVNSNTNQ